MLRRPDKGRRAPAPRPGPTTLEEVRDRLVAPEWAEAVARLDQDEDARADGLARPSEGESGTRGPP